MPLLTVVAPLDPSRGGKPSVVVEVGRPSVKSKAPKVTLRLRDFGDEVEAALNVESVDSKNGVCSDLDLDLATVVVGYEYIVGSDWGWERDE